MKPFAQTLRDLASAVHDESRGVNSKNVQVEKSDLQELLFHFNRIDDELRQKQRKPGKTTIQLETIDTLQHAALKSPRAAAVLANVKQAESSFELIRLLTAAFLHVDEEATRVTNELVNMKCTSPHITPVILSGDYKLID